MAAAVGRVQEVAARGDAVTAHALCRCGEQGGTAACPVHGQGNATRTVGLSRQQVPTIRCSQCGQELSARWDTDRTIAERYIAVNPHHCPTQDVRVVDASQLSDDELLAAVKARGLSGMAG
jgi:uncharacterized Zn finger protein